MILLVTLEEPGEKYFTAGEGLPVGEFSLTQDPC